jgi:hypothetical protein
MPADPLSLTPALLNRGFGWAKRLFAMTKRIATLEARVGALEEALAKQPADACPFCGERAMRMIASSPLLGDQGHQWWQESWTCGKCDKPQVRHLKL